MSEIRVVAGAGGAGRSGGGGSGTGSAGATDSLDRLGAPNLSELTIGATLVVGPWPELGLGGLLWDGRSLVAVDERSASVVDATLGARQPPVALQLSGLVNGGRVAGLGIPRLILGSGPGEVLTSDAPRAAPRPLAKIGPPAWATAVGMLVGSASEMELRLTHGTVRVDRRCADRWVTGGRIVGVTGIAVGRPTRVIVPCGGIVVAPTAQGRVAAAPVAAALRAGVPSPLPAADDPRRAVAAGLLGVAALGLAGVAAYLRRRARPESDPLPEAQLGGGADDLTAGPRLALVRLPREPGS